MADGIGDTATLVVAAIAAIGGLGTAAAGLVDATKAFWGGVSNVGFQHVERALRPFEPALHRARPDWARTLRASWINGVPTADQKASAKALIHFGLDAENVEAMAKAARTPADLLRAAIAATAAGATLNPQQQYVINRLDTAIDIALDSGFERADQNYRNAAKVLAGVASVVLAVWGEAMLENVTTVSAFQRFTHDARFGLAMLVGVIAVPLAPVAKDLSSSLQAAVKSMKATRS